MADYQTLKKHIIKSIAKFDCNQYSNTEIVRNVDVYMSIGNCVDSLEEEHKNEDGIMWDFIKLCKDNQLTIEQVQELSKLINRLNIIMSLVGREYGGNTTIK